MKKEPGFLMTMSLMSRAVPVLDSLPLFYMKGGEKGAGALGC